MAEAFRLKRARKALGGPPSLRSGQARNPASGFWSPVDSTVRRGGRKPDRDALAAASASQFMLPQRG